ncbi:MAG: sugar ABC transporter permease [Anaerolineae bacterium]|nr:MAG: sugar ABC transporter permease [Anaerolineae bacterium]
MEQAAQTPTKTKTRFQYLTDRESFLGSLFLLPAVLYIILLVGVPFGMAIAFSLSDVTVGDTSLDYVGLENFRRILNTPQFRRALVNSFIITLIAQLFVIILANILALIFYEDFPGKWMARMLIIMPWATPISLGTIGWLWIFDSKFSPIDWVLQQIGLLGPDTLLGPGKHLNYLGREELAMVAVIIVHVWRMLPLATVILLAGLASIDKDLIDQAQVDGAKFWRIHRDIRLPLIYPIMSIALLFGLIFTFSDMVVVFLLTRGGPIYYTQVLPTWAWFKGIDGGNLSEGAAVALFLFPLLLVAAILILRSAKRSEIT